MSAISNFPDHSKSSNADLLIAKWQMVPGPKVVQQALIDWVEGSPLYQVVCGWLTADLRFIQADTFLIGCDLEKPIDLEAIRSKASQSKAALAVIAINKIRPEGVEGPHHLAVKQMVFDELENSGIKVLDYFLVFENKAISWHERGYL